MAAFRKRLTVGVRVNGQPMVGEIAARETLLDWLRERAGGEGETRPSHHGVRPRVSDT